MYPDTLALAASPSAIAAELCRYLDAAAGGFASGLPFNWASRNCAHFAGNWWLRATQVDALLGLAMPASAAAARRWLRGQGAPLVDLVGPRIGRSRIAAAFAQVGDVVALQADTVVLAHAGRGAAGKGTGAGVALGICTGRLAAGLAPDGRVVHVPMARALCAWPLRPVPPTAAVMALAA